MNRDTVTLFTATRHSHSLGLLVAGAIFAVIGLGGSGAIVRNFVTAGTYASVATVTTQHLG
ncbi:MAG TPA: hypothetical protein VMT11_04315 [Myxococcaceae bacterium]|nr:hypothetical protein [Myxococcaceae bacterium]